MDNLANAVAALSALEDELPALLERVETAERERSEALALFDQVGRLKSEIVRLEMENTAWRKETERLQQAHERCGVHILTEQQRADEAERQLASNKE